jgi:plastocyanin
MSDYRRIAGLAYRRIAESAPARVFALILIIAAGVMPVAAAGGPPPIIEIRAFAFVPREITVAVGTRVTWINRDQTIHSIIGPTGAFASPGLDTDDKFETTLNHAGDFTYVCSLHPFMTGIVHVREHTAKTP